eukprot:gene8990-1614_t
MTPLPLPSDLANHIASKRKRYKAMFASELDRAVLSPEYIDTATSVGLQGYTWRVVTTLPSPCPCLLVGPPGPSMFEEIRSLIASVQTRNAIATCLGGSGDDLMEHWRSKLEFVLEHGRGVAGFDPSGNLVFFVGLPDLCDALDMAAPPDRRLPDLPNTQVWALMDQQRERFIQQQADTPKGKMLAELELVHSGRWAKEGNWNTQYGRWVFATMGGSRAQDRGLLRLFYLIRVALLARLGYRYMESEAWNTTTLVSSLEGGATEILSAGMMAHRFSDGLTGRDKVTSLVMAGEAGRKLATHFVEPTLFIHDIRMIYTGSKKLSMDANPGHLTP